MAGQPSFEARDLELWRGDRRLFHKLSFRVEAGELLHVRGANGAGKTSLLRVLSGLTAAETGEIYWCGEKVREQRSAFAAACAYLGHLNALHEDLTAVENLRWGVGLHGEHRDAQMDEALGRVGLTAQRDLFAFSLSAGQRRRLALCRTLLSGAALWLLDEPMANLDVAGRDWCAGRIEAHVDQGGLVIMTDHRDLSLAGDSYRKLEMTS